MSEEDRTKNLEEIRNERIQKGDTLVSKGHELYPSKTDRTHTIQEVRDSFESFKSEKTKVTVAARVLSIREHGGSVFIDLYDGTESIQGFLKKDEIGEDLFSLFSETIDRGDFIDLKGTCFTTKRGEPSILASDWRILTKTLSPIPTEHFGIKDEEERYRKRYLDILLNKDVRDRIKRRSVFWNTARNFLLEKGFIEVETPVLETTPGGADARPFTTHHNALDMEVHLRISAGELWQKKLMVAGIPKTFEIGRIFRNEGISNEHLQDYTQLELYESFSDFSKGKKLTKELFLALAKETFGTTTFTIRDFEIELDSDWVDYDFSKIIEESYGFDPRETDEETMTSALKEAKIDFDNSKSITLERGVDLLWKKCRTKLGGPGFLVNVPVYLEPLAKRSREDPRVVERFQVILAGSELAKGFSELNDPRDQEKRFDRQEELREQGDDEAQFANKEFVEALEFGMPPSFGLGVSERLFSFLEGVSVREGTIFPLLKPKN